MPRKGAKTNEDSFKVPILKKFKVVDLERLTPEKAEAAAKKLREKTLPDLQEEMVIALTWLDGMEESSSEAQELAEKAMKESRQWVQDQIENEFGPYRRTAWITLLTHYSSKNLESREKCQELMDFLCGKEYICEAEGGSLELFGKTYSVSEAANLDESKILQLKEAFADLEKRTQQQERLAHFGRYNALLKEGKISTKELLGGKPGLYSVLLPNGVLVVKSSGQRVFPYNALGEFQEDMEKLKKAERFLLLHTLNWETISPNFFTEKVQLGQEEARMMLDFWRYLKQGMYRKMQQERVQVFRERCAADQTISPKAYLFEDKIGITFLSHEGPFDWYVPGKGNQKVYNLFFSVERQEQEGGPATRIVRYPPWLKEMLSGCQNGFYSEGERFGKLPRNLRMVIRSVWTQHEKRRQMQSRA